MTDSSDLGSKVRRFEPIPNVLSSATTSSCDPEKKKDDSYQKKMRLGTVS
jgi:hypothetical protein